MGFPWLARGEPPPNTGKPMPESQRQKLSKAKKALVAAGWKPGNYGKKMKYSSSHVEKLRANFRRAAEIIRKYQPGDTFPDRRPGYVWIYAPGHPGANPAGYVHEHRVKAQHALGRPIKAGEIVHHVDGNPSNNANSNLLLCDRVYHRWLHERMAELFQIAVFREV